MLVELFNCFAVDVLEEVGGLCLLLRLLRSCATSLPDAVGLLFDPKVFGRFEIVAENGDNLLDLLIRVSIDEEVRVELLLIFLAASHVELKLDLSPTRHRLVSPSKSLVFIVRVELMNKLG